MPTAVHIPSRLSELTNDLSLSGVSTGDLASTTDVAKGPALVGYKTLNLNGSGFATGAVARSVAQKLLEVPIYVEDFGAVGDGTTDDHVAIQAAIDHCLHTTNPGRFNVKFATGKNYAISQPLIIARKNVGGTEFDFVVLTLSGDDVRCYASVFPQVPQITQTDKTLPGIIIQHGRSVTIRGLTLVGQNPFTETLDWSPSHSPPTAPYLSSGVANGRYNPHGAIVTDPFVAAVTGGGQYPGLSSWYISTGAGGSSATLIDRCFLYRWAVGAAFSVGGAQQGDDYQVRDTMAYVCDVGFSPGGTQCRDGNFFNVSCSLARYFVNEKIYGQITGEMPNIFGGQLSQIDYVFGCESLGWGNFNCVGLYFEDCKSLGTFIGDSPANFTGCSFNFSNTTPLTGYNCFSNAPLTFTGCLLAHDDGPLTFVASVNIVSFHGCNLYGGRGNTDFSGSIPNLVVSDPALFRFYSCNLATTYPDPATISQDTILSSTADLKRKVVASGAFLSAVDDPVLYRIRPQSHSGEVACIGAWLTPTFDGSGRPVFDIGSTNYTDTVQVGDILVTAYGNSILANTAGRSGTLGMPGGVYAARVYAKSGSQITLDYVVQHLLDVVPTLVPGWWPRYHPETLGDVTWNSKTISNVSNPSAWAIGDRIQAIDPVTGQALTYRGNYIANISGSTITLGAVARTLGGPNFGTIRARLIDADVEEIAARERPAGSLHVQGMATPAFDGWAAQGTTGSTSYTYYVVAVDRYGNRTVPSAPITIADGNATLTTGNYNFLQWMAIKGAVSYDILKGNTSTLLGSVSGVYQANSAIQFNDTGQSTSVYTPATANETGHLVADGPLSALGGPQLLATGASHTIDDVISLLQAVGLARQS